MLRAFVLSTGGRLKQSPSTGHEWSLYCEGRGSASLLCSAPAVQTMQRGRSVTFPPSHLWVGNTSRKDLISSSQRRWRTKPRLVWAVLFVFQSAGIKIAPWAPSTSHDFLLSPFQKLWLFNTWCHLELKGKKYSRLAVSCYHREKSTQLHLENNDQTDSILQKVYWLKRGWAQ